MVNNEKVRSKIRVIKECLQKLNGYKLLPETDFIADHSKTDAARYNLQTAIEAMLDIANHIIARQVFEVPKTNADSFIILCKHRILPQEKQPVYTAMARFRNRVVHLYDEVDDREVYRVLQEHLGDFTDFIGEIVQNLKMKDS